MEAARCRLCGLLLAVMLAGRAAAGACVAGDARFVLTAVGGAAGTACAASELAVLWPQLHIQVEDCATPRYRFGPADPSGPRSKGLTFAFPTTFAPATLARGRRYTALATLTATGGDNSWQDPDSIAPWAEPEQHRPATLQGLLASWSLGGLPLLQRGPSTPSTHTPAPYAIAQAGPSAFVLTSNATRCAFTYRIVRGEFGGLKPSPCEAAGPGCLAPGREACPPGRFKLAQPAGAPRGAAVCALCPAGTFSADGAGAGSCSECAPGTAAPQAGAASCSSCEAPLVPSAPASSACVPCTEVAPQGHTIFAGGPACTPVACPPGSAASASNECVALSAATGELCIAKSTASAASAATCGGSASAADRALGGAVLALEPRGSDLRARVCASGVSELAAWLGAGQRLTWMGFNLSARPAAGDRAPVPGLQWQVLGAPAPGPLNSFPRCNPHGGSGDPQPSLTTGGGSMLDAGTFVFQSLLKGPAERAAASTQAGEPWRPRTTWRVLASAGSAAHTIRTQWIRDGSIATCPDVTPLSVRKAAGGEDATGVCELQFRVVAGRVLGVAAPGASSCPSGTTSAGSGGCLACDPGTAGGGGVKACAACAPGPAAWWGRAAC